jgi:signal transduction histidine kinase
MNALADEYLRLSYHVMRAKDKDFNATLQTDFDESIGKINVVPQDIGRVLLNLYNNAFYATQVRAKQSGAEYKPLVTVTTKKTSANMFGANSSPSGAEGLIISVRDNGNGIPQKVIDKIFQPFFTTKPTGQGTGLGLSLSYDIIKAHGGEIRVESKAGEGSEFIINLPIFTT